MHTQTAATINSPLSPASSVQRVEESEMRRWTLLLGTLMLAACVCVALAFGTHAHWLYGGAILFGPGLGVLAIIYLSLTSDTNGTGASANHRTAAHPVKLESLAEAAAA